MEEREAIARLNRGDIAGLETLVRQYQVQAVRTAYLITRDRALAEDIVQAAFLRVYERIGQFDTKRPFGPWFLRSVVNDAIKAATRHEHQVYLVSGAKVAFGVLELCSSTSRAGALQSFAPSTSLIRRVRHLREGRGAPRLSSLFLHLPSAPSLLAPMPS